MRRFYQIATIFTLVVTQSMPRRQRRRNLVM
jgi:hypothetical protein